MDDRGCTKAGTKTVAAVAKSCPSLTELNLNYTSVTPISLVPVLRSCRELEVLKAGGIPNWVRTQTYRTTPKLILYSTQD